ncbi:MAG TPA: hypothetical protein PK843_05275 [bacterium]|nr:hypothetical protein [bacterium]HPN33901.1 hypothetical protein [bacterium]
MSKENNRLPSCPSRRELELFCLQTGLSRAEKLRVQRHLAQCGKCRRTCRFLDRCNNLLCMEMQRPVANTALDLAKSLAPKQVRYGLLICTPSPDHNQGAAKAYRTQLVFSANGEAGRNKLRDFDLKKIPQGSLALRLYTDPKDEKLLLFLWEPGPRESRPDRLRWSGRRASVSFNRIGAGGMDLSDFSHLDNQLVYFSKSINKKSRLRRWEILCGR